MSEPISAFVAYRAAASKGGNTGRKSNKKAGGGAAGGSQAGANKKTEEKNKSLQKDKPKSGAKNRAEVKPSGVAKENGAPAKNKGAANREKDGSAKAKDATKKTTPKVETPKTKSVANKAANKTEPAKQKQKGERAVTNGKQMSNGIKGNDIDTLVEKLLGDSPSNPKKLTKAQQKKKQELEDYLVRQLEQYDEEAGEEEVDSEFDSEEDYSSGSEEFSEYTINSYTDDDEESGEEETELGGEYPTESVGKNVPVAKSTKNKAAVPKRTELGVESSTESVGENEPVATSTKNITAVPKRKSNEGAVAKTGSEASVPKKSRQAEKPVDKRKSMPAAEAAVAATEKIGKVAPKRHSIASSTSDSASASKVTIKTVDAKMVKMEPLSPPNNIVKMNSIQEGEKVFRWLLSPLAVKEFFAKYWEAGAFLVKRKGSNYYSHLMSFEAIDQMLIKNHVEFTKNIDITSYKNGERQTLNPVGRAMPPIVWDHYGRGCSIRLLNPQTFLPELFQLNTTLQEYFHCLVGANAYLTPPNSQGFAPHYDDIEAFVLQIEGRKRWRLYKPRTQAEQLPRFSSKNFEQQEIGKPIFDEVLEPGDMLYFPRGTIHQACTEPGYHSLHITLSVYQKQSYADLFERMVPLVLQRAIESNLDMRRGLPLQTFQHAGIAYSDNDTQERAELLRKVTKLFGQCLDSAPLAEMMDAAVDQLAKKYQHEALPPHVLPTERARTIFGSRSTTNEQGECMCDYEIDERTNVRLLRANILRLVQEESKVRIYYYLDNSKEYCEYEPNFIEIESDEAASVEVLIRSYPEYVGVSQLPMDEEERKVQMVTALWERGLLMTEKPFK